MRYQRDNYWLIADGKYMIYSTYKLHEEVVQAVDLIELTYAACKTVCFQKDDKLSKRSIKKN